MKLENAEILHHNSDVELRLSFDNGQNHVVFLSHQCPVEGVANTLNKLAARIRRDNRPTGHNQTHGRPNGGNHE